MDIYPPPPSTHVEGQGRVARTTSSMSGAGRLCPSVTTPRYRGSPSRSASSPAWVSSRYILPAPGDLRIVQPTRALQLHEVPRHPGSPTQLSAESVDMASALCLTAFRSSHVFEFAELDQPQSNEFSGDVNKADSAGSNLPYHIRVDSGFPKYAIRFEVYSVVMCFGAFGVTISPLVRMYCVFLNFPELVLPTAADAGWYRSATPHRGLFHGAHKVHGFGMHNLLPDKLPDNILHFMPLPQCNDPASPNNDSGTSNMTAQYHQVWERSPTLPAQQGTDSRKTRAARQLEENGNSRLTGPRRKIDKSIHISTESATDPRKAYSGSSQAYDD
ncbi:hypothetical protein B0H14DRAFT_2611789 [Mycena olivaceomarginata]|nr:hypothetical protein B0H14DRAFT_2611789 [Mycena olivaceomarginata]